MAGLRVGDVLQGRYSIEGILGEGGMGAVYKASDLKIRRVWAIKEMTDNFQDDGERREALEGFAAECNILASLYHPNLPQIGDFFSENGRQYLVMELVEGNTLEKLLHQKGRLSVDETLEIARQLSDVLRYLHEQPQPIIFRDLKPANIIITSRGVVKLIDFGIARFFRADKKTDTRALGTPGYAAPEQYGSGQTDARSDIYALGATLHQALTGINPSIQPFSFVPVSSAVPNIPPAIDGVIAKAVALDRNFRYASAQEFYEALEHVKGSVSGGSAASSSNVAANVAASVVAGYSVAHGEANYNTGAGQAYGSGGMNQGYSTGSMNQGYNAGGMNQGYNTGGMNQGYNSGGVNQGYNTGGVNQGYSTRGMSQGYNNGGMDQGYAQNGYKTGNVDRAYNSGGLNSGKIDRVYGSTKYTAGRADSGYDSGSYNAGASPGYDPGPYGTESADDASQASFSKTRIDFGKVKSGAKIKETVILHGFAKGMVTVSDPRWMHIAPGYVNGTDVPVEITIDTSALPNGRQEGHISYKDSTVIVGGEIEPANASIFAMATGALCVLGCFFSLLAFFFGSFLAEIPVLSFFAGLSTFSNIIFVPLSWLIYLVNRRKKQSKLLLTFALLISGLCALGVVIVIVIVAYIGVTQNDAQNQLNDPLTSPTPSPYSTPAPVSKPSPVSELVPGIISPSELYCYYPYPCDASVWASGGAFDIENLFDYAT